MKETEKFDPAQVSLITTCMNRNEFLRESLRTWLGIGFAKIIIVDWNSEVPVAPYLEEYTTDLGRHPVLIVRSDDHEMKQYFNDGWARNTGARLCETQYIFFADSDIKIRNESPLWDQVPLDPVVCYRGNIPGGYGSCLVSRERFEKVNGYNERMWSWGGEDLDLYIRLKVEQGCEIETFFPEDLLEHIYHDDNLRVENRFQEWEDLKHGADVQRLDRPQWTVHDQQSPVLATLYDMMSKEATKRVV